LYDDVKRIIGGKFCVNELQRIEEYIGGYVLKQLHCWFNII